MSNETLSGYYVSMQRSRTQKALLLGPFPARELAEAHVKAARLVMTGNDPFAWFDGFGVACYTTRKGMLPTGKLNFEKEFAGLQFGHTATLDQVD
jgi:hypothetical protein